MVQILLRKAMRARVKNTHSQDEASLIKNLRFQRRSEPNWCEHMLLKLIAHSPFAAAICSHHHNIVLHSRWRLTVPL